MSYPEYENIIVEPLAEPEGVVRVTLNRPQALNALSADLLDEFFDFLDHFEDDPKRVRAAVAWRGTLVLRGLRPGLQPHG